MTFVDQRPTLDPTSAAVDRICRSNTHHSPVAAVTVGVFDLSDGPNPPEPDSAYCLGCAVLLADIGWFTPTDGAELPDAETYIALRDDPRR